MESYELFQQEPAVYIPIFLLSVAVTAFAYGAYPMLFALLRRKPITKKKYRILCFVFNLFVMTVFTVIDGEPSGGPCFLWTTVFSQAGLNLLESREILGEFTATIPDNIKFCRCCGKRLRKGSRFCNSCGTEVFSTENMI